MRRNRNVKRTRYGPKETEKLKAALTFEYNDQTEKAHLSIFHDGKSKMLHSFVYLTYYHVIICISL